VKPIFRVSCLVALVAAVAGVPIERAAGATAAPGGPPPADRATQNGRAPAGNPGIYPTLSAKPAGNPPASPLPPARPPPGKNLEALPLGKYTGILGKKVAGPDGQDLGLIVDVVVDVDGTPRAAVIDFGGFLGVGSRKIAVDWRLLNFAPDRTEGQIWLSLGRAQIQAAPEYRPDAESDQMVGPPWAIVPSPAGGK